jgi:hypothetical protein
MVEKMKKSRKIIITGVLILLVAITLVGWKIYSNHKDLNKCPPPGSPPGIYNCPLERSK